MNRAVVTPQRTAWCRSQRATSRCTAGRDGRCRCGRGGKRAAWATLPGMTAPCPPCPPAQNAVHQHDGHGLPMQPRPACGRRSGSSAHVFGRDNRTATGQVAGGSLSPQVTATWQWPTWPRGPAYCRAPPTAAVPGVGKPISSNTNTPAPRVAAAIIFATRWRVRSSSSHGLLVRNACTRCARVPGMAWAMGSPGVWGSSVSRPGVERSKASRPSGRRKRTWKAPKHSRHAVNLAGLAGTSMGILLLLKRIPERVVY
jgi:hypothetical protein